MESLPEAVREGSDASRPGEEDDDRGDVMLGCAAADGEWFDPLEAYNLLVGSDSKQKRIGPLATLAFSSHFPSDLSFKFNLCVQGQVKKSHFDHQNDHCHQALDTDLACCKPKTFVAFALMMLHEWWAWWILIDIWFMQQEYPPGIFIAPMESATMLPFSKTNLVVFAPTGPLPKHAIDTGAATAFGDALICDPGCHPVAAHAQVCRPLKICLCGGWFKPMLGRTYLDVGKLSTYLTFLSYAIVDSVF